MNKIHILGASGSGVTTLGKKLSEILQIPQFDSDDYYWKKTNPPFQIKNSIEERQKFLLSDIQKQENWIISGALDSWGEPFVPLFGIVIFLYVPTQIRLERLKARESLRYGTRIQPGGDMHKTHLDFLEWASHYDDGSQSGRNLPRHKEWLSSLKCPILKYELEYPISFLTDDIIKHLNKGRSV